MSDFSKKRLSYDKQNEVAARTILGDVAKYGGAEALPVLWAAAVLGIVKNQLPLFDREAA